LINLNADQRGYLTNVLLLTNFHETASLAYKFVCSDSKIGFAPSFGILGPKANFNVYVRTALDDKTINLKDKRIGFETHLAEAPISSKEYEQMGLDEKKHYFDTAIKQEDFKEKLKKELQVNPEFIEHLIVQQMDEAILNNQI